MPRTTTPELQYTWPDIHRPIPPPPPGRKASGVPPMRVVPTTVLEEIPTHDGTPCFTAWYDIICYKTDPRHVDRGGWRPTWGHQIYDTRPGADDPTHLAQLAKRLHEETDKRGKIEDRLDVYGLPMPEGTPARERAERCIAHNVAEAHARNATGRSDYYIPTPFRVHSRCRHVLLIIDRPEERWEEGPNGRGDKGGFLRVLWALDHEVREEQDRSLKGWQAMPEDAYPFKSVARFARMDLQAWMAHDCEGSDWFEAGYVARGIVARGLRAYARDHAGQQAGVV